MSTAGLLSLHPLAIADVGLPLKNEIMTWNEIFDLLKNFGFFGFFMWGIQKIINNSADMKMEKFRNDFEHNTIKFQNDLNIERDKLKLKIEKLKYKNSKLHDKQADVIENLYGKLVSLDKVIREFTATLKILPKNEREREIAKKKKLDNINISFSDFSNYFAVNKIFFNQRICDTIEELLKIYHKKMNEYIFPAILKREGIERKEMKEELEKSREAAKYIKDEIPKRLVIIEEEFRKILNVAE